MNVIHYLNVKDFLNVKNFQNVKLIMTMIDFNKIKFISNDSLPLGKLIYFPTLTVVIRCVIKQGDLFYPQVYLDDAIYQL